LQADLTERFCDLLMGLAIC